jgi:hypothetical protein
MATAPAVAIMASGMVIQRRRWRTAATASDDIRPSTRAANPNFHQLTTRPRATSILTSQEMAAAITQAKNNSKSRNR